MNLKPTHRFILSLVLVVGTLLLLDQIAGKLLSTYYFSAFRGEIYRVNRGINHTQADILVIGASRAKYHIIPEIITNATHKSCYNIGRDNGTIYSEFGILKCVLKRYHPKLIILEISPEDLCHYQYEMDEIAQLLPYYNHNPELRPILLLRGPFERFKLLSKTYPFNSTLYQIIAANHSGSKSTSNQNGFVPLPALISMNADEIPQQRIYPTSGINAQKVAFLDSVITIAKRDHVPLLFMQSPFLLPKQSSTEYSMLSLIAKKNAIPFWDYSNDTMFINKPEFFFDQIHLNERGARLFTSKVARQLREGQIVNW